MSASEPTDIRFSFAGLMQRGGKTGKHKDGWGIAFYEGKGCRVFHDPDPSMNSEVAKLIRRYPIKSRGVISHIRLANVGKVSLENTHPFVRNFWGRNWCFAHNGQLKGYKKLKLKTFLPVGTTDSEYVFCWILEQLKKKFKTPPRSDKKLWEFIETLCHKIAKYGVFNMLLGDSKYLYAYCSTKLVWVTRKAPFGRAKLIDDDMEIDFHKYNNSTDIISIIATSPLTENEDWFKFNKHEFIVFKDGQLCNKDE